MPALGEFPAGAYGLRTPVSELLADPRARRLLGAYIPQLTRTEMLGMLGDVSVYGLAATATIPVSILHALADALAALPAGQDEASRD